MSATNETGDGQLPKMKLEFLSIKQRSQEIGGDEHMSASVACRLTPANGVAVPVEIEVKQTVGERFASPLEVGRPVGYKGPVDHAAFRNAVETYYRRMISVGGDTSRMGIKMMNNEFVSSWVTEIPQPIDSAQGW